MKKRVNSVLAALVLAGIALFLTVEGAKAFCVYNKTDKKISVRQVEGHKMGHGLSVSIYPNGNECCNWQNKDCNKAGKKDSIVKFNVLESDGNIRPPELPEKKYCQYFAIQAGGWLTVEGRDGNYKCVRHDY